MKENEYSSTQYYILQQTPTFEKDKANVRITIGTITMRFFSLLVFSVGAAAAAAAAASINEKDHAANTIVSKSRRMLKGKNSNAMKGSKKKKRKSDKDDSIRYEVWASDQSNSVPNQTSLGMKGSFMWIYDSTDIHKMLSSSPSLSANDIKPLSCLPGTAIGPCNVLDVFPRNLEQLDGTTGFKTGLKLDDLDGFGRLHGVFVDESTNRYINANFFAPGGAYIGEWMMYHSSHHDHNVARFSLHFISFLF